MKTVSWLSAAAFACLNLLAQGPGTGPARHAPGAMAARHMEGLASRLSLTDAQKEKATAIYESARTSAQGLRAGMKQAHDALATAVQKNDGVGIDKASLQIGTLMAQEISIQSKADAAFRQTLSADQIAKFDQMHAHRGPLGPRPLGPHRPAPSPQ